MERYPGYWAPNKPYFFLIVVIYILNLIFLLIPDPGKQTVMVTFQSVVTSILAQRIITSLSERTENVHSSDHHNASYTARDRSKSGSRTGGCIFSKMPVPPAASYMSHSINGTEPHTRPDVEMVKIQIGVHKQVQHDDDVKADRERMHNVSLA